MEVGAETVPLSFGREQFYDDTHKFRRQPPVFDVYRFLRVTQSLRESLLSFSAFILDIPLKTAYPKVIPAIDIPLDQIAISFWRKAIKPVTLTDPTSLLICLLLVLLVVAMIRVKQIGELPDLVLRMRRPDFHIVKLCILELLAQLRKRMRDLVLQPPVACAV
jgi:hypothetical protein